MSNFLKKDVSCFIKRWSIAPKLRKPRFHAALVAVDNRLYLCGGATYPGNDVDCDVTHSVYAIDTYVPGSGSWQYETDMLISRHEAGVAVTGRFYPDVPS